MIITNIKQVKIHGNPTNTNVLNILCCEIYLRQLHFLQNILSINSFINFGLSNQPSSWVHFVWDEIKDDCCFVVVNIFVFCIYLYVSVTFKT